MGLFAISSTFVLSKSANMWRYPFKSSQNHRKFHTFLLKTRFYGNLWIKDHNDVTWSLKLCFYIIALSFLFPEWAYFWFHDPWFAQKIAKRKGMQTKRLTNSQIMKMHLLLFLLQAKKFAWSFCISISIWKRLKFILSTGYHQNATMTKVCSWKFHKKWIQILDFMDDQSM